MAEDTKDQIEQRLAELPDDVREAVLSVELGTKVHAVGQAHNLHVDQIGKLEDETMLVMLGFFNPDEFNKQLEEQLLIPAADAAALAGDINTQIFLPIRESLKRFTESKRAGTQALPIAAPIQIQVPIPAAPVQKAPLATQIPIRITPQPPIVAPTPPVTAIQIAPITPAPTPIPAVPVIQTPVPQPPIPPMPNAEQVLSEPVVVKSAYKTDPYREPVE